MVNHRYLISILFILASIPLLAQSQILQLNFETPNDAEIVDLHVNADQSAIILLNDTVNNFGRVVFLNSDGEAGSSFNYHSGDYTRFQSMSVNENSEIFIRAELDPEQASTQYILKLDSVGNVLWAKKLNTEFQSSENVINCISAGDDGGVLLGTRHSLDISNPINRAATFIYLDPDGNSEWEVTKGIISQGSVSPITCVTDENGDFFCLSRTFGIYSVNGESDYDGYLLKISSEGEVQGQQRFGLEGNDRFGDMTIDSQNEPWILGRKGLNTTLYHFTPSADFHAGFTFQSTGFDGQMGELFTFKIAPYLDGVALLGNYVMEFFFSPFAAYIHNSELDSVWIIPDQQLGGDRAVGTVSNNVATIGFRNYSTGLCLWKFQLDGSENLCTGTIPANITLELNEEVAIADEGIPTGSFNYSFETPNYTVHATGAETTSICTSVSARELIAKEFVVYPNPVYARKINIDLKNNTQNRFCELFDAYGQVVMRFNIIGYSRKETIQLPATLSAGIYFLHIGGSKLSQKIVVL